MTGFASKALNPNAKSAGHFLYVTAGSGKDIKDSSGNEGVSPGVIKFKVAEYLRAYPGDIEFAENLLQGNFAILIKSTTV